MKSRIIVLVTISLTVCIITMPAFSVNKPEFSLKAGYHYFWFSQPDDGHFIASYHYPDNGWFIAGGVNLPTPGIFSMNCELQYLYREFSVQSAWGGLGGGSEAKYHYRLGNLFLKAEPRFNFGEKKVRFFCYPGLFIGILTNSSVEGTLYTWGMGTPFYSHTDNISGSARGYYPDFELGCLAGAGLDYKINENLRCTFSYDFRVNLFNVSGEWGSDRVKMFGMDFGLGVIYTFGKR